MKPQSHDTPPRAVPASKEYPRALHRGGQTAIVNNDEEKAVAFANGWQLAPTKEVLEILQLGGTPEKPQSITEPNRKEELVQILERSKNSAVLIDLYYSARFDSAQGPGKLQIVRDYFDRYPHLVVGSEWVKPAYLNHLPPTRNVAEQKAPQTVGAPPVGMAAVTEPVQEPAGKMMATKPPRGPKPKMEYHRAIAAIVHPYGNDWQAESNLDKIAAELDRDKAKTPPPKAWAKRKPPARSWGRALRDSQPLVIKSISYSLKMAARVSGV